jgi:hypothetical protein
MGLLLGPDGLLKDMVGDALDGIDLTNLGAGLNELLLGSTGLLFDADEGVLPGGKLTLGGKEIDVMDLL